MSESVSFAGSTKTSLRLKFQLFLPKSYIFICRFFIKTAPENPVLWTGMKGASAESRKNKPDAEISSA